MRRTSSVRIPHKNTKLSTPWDDDDDQESPTREAKLR
jgi:hypothetical protein